jgi:hypothetical protein
VAQGRWRSKRRHPRRIAGLLLLLGLGLILLPHLGPEQGRDLRLIGRWLRSLRPCPLPAPDSLWAQDIQAAPVDPRSATWIAALGAETGLIADFGAERGVPVQRVDWRHPMRPLRLLHAANSDAVGYPVDAELQLERADAAHPQRSVLLDREACWSYELVEAQLEAGGGSASRAERVDLRAGPRTDGGWFTPAPAASHARWHDGSGIPLIPLLVLEEDAAGPPIAHALRLSAPNLQRAYVPPARWAASPDVDPDRLPMGARLRLRRDFDCSQLKPQAARICAALQVHGAFIAEKGRRVAIEGQRAALWDRADLDSLSRLLVGDLEVIEAGPTTSY